MADQEPFTSSHGVITAASSSFFPYILHSATKIGKKLVQLSNIVCVTGPDNYTSKAKKINILAFELKSKIHCSDWHYTNR